MSNEIHERIASILFDHYPQGEKCRCGQAIADAGEWADHTAGILDNDGRKWVAERIG